MMTSIILSHNKNRHMTAVEAYQKMHVVSSSSCISTGKLTDPSNITIMLRRFATIDVTCNQFVGAHLSLQGGVNYQISAMCS